MLLTKKNYRMIISIVLVTYNRREQILETIQAFLNQTYENKEIIVIDNASSDGTAESIKRYFPQIKLIELPENFAIKGLNIGFYEAKGDLIWRGDDDSYPRDIDLLEKIVDEFKTHKEIDLIATEQIEMEPDAKSGTIYHWYGKNVDKENIPVKGYPTHVFHGPGVVFKKEIFQKVGGFWGFGYEELDFATKAIIEGYNLRYYPQFVTLHFSSRFRSVKNKKYTANRTVGFETNLVKYYWKYFPFTTAFFNTILINFNVLFLILTKFLNPLILLQTLGLSIHIAIDTRRNEYQKINKKIRDRFTNNESLFTRYYKFYLEIFKRKFKIG